jgi:hypothetical protein
MLTSSGLHFWRYINRPQNDDFDSQTVAASWLSWWRLQTSTRYTLHHITDMFNYACVGLISSALLLLLVNGDDECVCNKKEAPVCAQSEDGREHEFRNRCLAACEGYDGSSVNEGLCAQPECPCTNEWNPVCASNGDLFGNECALDCSGFLRGDDSLCTHATQLPAVKRSHRRHLCICTSEYDRVCDKDGHPFSNRCIAECAGAGEVSAHNCRDKRSFKEY